MEKKSNVFESFESALEKQKQRKPVSIYTNKVEENIDNASQERLFTTKEVLSNISKQLSAIQSADSYRKDLVYRYTMHKNKKSAFIPLNLLEFDEKIPQQQFQSTNKFETQSVSDTQLINIVENAEKNVAPRGVTQEFDTSFCEKHIASKEEDKRLLDNINDIHKNNEDKKVAEENLQISYNTLTCKKLEFLNNGEHKPNTCQNSKEDICNEGTNFSSKDCMYNKDNDINEEIQNLLSPIINPIKPLSVSSNPSPLIYTLDAFESFEALAFPVIKNNTNIETAKQLINSQIINMELCLGGHTKPSLCKGGRSISPVLNLKRNEYFAISPSTSTNVKFANNMLKDPGKSLEEECETVIDMNKCFEDEILFSSDEENSEEKDYQELPFTCALETSFYNQSDILDKTMYVGFQTASNKSIIINTDSYCKAKNILDLDSSKSTTFTELVAKCDTGSLSSISSNNEIKNVKLCTEKIVINCNKTKHESKSTEPSNAANVYMEEGNLSKKSQGSNNNNQEENVTEDKILFDNVKSMLHDHKYLRKISNILEQKECNFVDFQTASNKRIKLSEKALSRCRQLFEDIDLDTKYDQIEPKNTECSTQLLDPPNHTPKFEIRSNISNMYEMNENDMVQVAEQIELNDQNIIQEFENYSICNDENKNLCSTENMLNLGTNYLYNKYEWKFYKDPSNCVKETKDEHNHLLTKPHLDYRSNVDDTKLQHQINETSNSHENVDGIAVNETFVGFKTASNKVINISKQAFQKVKNMFDDLNVLDNIDNNYNKDINDNGTIATNNMGVEDLNTMKIKNGSSDKNLKCFSSYKENENNCSISHDSKSDDHCNKATSQLQNAAKICDNVLYSSKMLENNYNNYDSVSFAPCGFKTANNKPVIISSEALVKSKRLFKEMESSICEVSDFHHEVRQSEFQGLKTALSNGAHVSEKTLTKPKDVFQDVSNEVFKHDSAGIKCLQNSCKNIGLHTYDKNQKIFGALDFDENNVIAENKNIEKLPSNVFKGFFTASNKKVRISANALEKSKKIFEDLKLDDNSRKSNDYSSSKMECDDFNGKASNNKYYSDDAFDPLVKNETSQNVTKGVFKGFQTASNKQVNVSDRALAKSKKLFQDLGLNDKSDMGNEGTLNTLNKNSTDRLKTTDKQHEFVECVGLSKKELSQTVPEQIPVGFHTASNKRVTISDKALATSKKLFQDIDLNNETSDSNAHPNAHHKSPFEFKTGNNEKIKVSEEAMLNSRKILESCNNITSEMNKVAEEIKVNEEINNLENIIDTQVLNNFEETLYTEDFCKEINSNKSKRSGSPILSCPRAKKLKKFEVPYRSENLLQELKLKRVVFTSEPHLPFTFAFDKNYKKNKKYTLKILRSMENLKENEKGVDPYILKFSYDNILEFKFRGQRNNLRDVTWSTDDVKKYFLSLVDRKIIPDGWLENHLKLIIYKLISYEIVFQNNLKGVCTVKNVLEQLKYRYDRELYNVERPALRKLLEKDDVSTKTMILRVLAIYKDGVTVSSVTNTNNIELLLTDGWYCIKACLDQMLSKLVRDNKIRVGTKLATHGAELLNCEQGKAPWEDTSSVRLKLFGNSTRRARWDARLGYHGAGAILTPLSSVELDGGKVSKLRAFVTRVYPMLYVEKFEDGSTVTRSERLENLYQIKYDSERQATLEKIYEEVEKEFADQESQDSECDSEIRSLDSGSQISRLMKQCKDPGANLTNTQCVMLQNYKSRRRERLVQSMQNRIEERLKAKGLHCGRNVVPLLKIRVADVGGNVAVSKAMVSVWRPNDALLDILKEGTRINMFNIVPTAMRYSEIQLSAGRQTVFSQSNDKSSDNIKNITTQLQRTCYSTKDLVKNPTLNTDYNEIDTVGLIFWIDPSIDKLESIKGQPFQNVYLTDVERNIICINFWGGLKKFGFENILDTGQVVACMNLQKRAGNSRKNIPQFRVTEFTYFTKTPKDSNVRRVVEELNKSLAAVNVIKLCQECVMLKNNYSVSKHNNGENVSPYRMNYSDYNLSKHKAFIDSPLSRKPNYVDDILNLSGLDFESTFKQIDTQDLSPSVLQRKQKVKEKIAKLKMYGEPPPLKPIHIINKSKNATSAFKSPLTSKNDGNDNVASLKSEESTNYAMNDLKSSPVMRINKSYVKRINVCPVKLNFANEKLEGDSNVENTVDPFAEEFDVSPPLSLD